MEKIRIDKYRVHGVDMHLTRECKIYSTYTSLIKRQQISETFYFRTIIFQPLGEQYNFLNSIAIKEYKIFRTVSIINRKNKISQS